MGCCSIWKFAQNKEAAQQFLADLCIAGKDGDDRSRSSTTSRRFAEAMPFTEIRKVAAADTHKPKGKYTILTTIAEKYTHNIGYPGTTNAAIDEIFSKYLIPQMFAQVVAGQAERRGLGAPHEHRDQGHLREVAEAEDALSYRRRAARPSSRSRSL